MGALTSLLFHLGTKEPVGRRSLSNVESTATSYEETSGEPRMAWRHWFKEYQFYLVSGVIIGLAIFWSQNDKIKQTL